MGTTQKLGLEIVAFNKTAQAFASVQKDLGAINRATQALKGLAVFAAASLSFAALGSSIKSAVDRMDEMGKAAQKIGIPVEELSKLEYAAKLADVSLDQVNSTVSRFSKSLAEIGSGGKNDAASALKALGISATDAQGELRPTTEIIMDVADSFATMRDGAGKTALAMALFGKSGTDLIPILNGGSQAITDAGAELEQFGGVVTPQASAAAELFNDNLTRLQAAGNGLTTLIASKLAPIMADITERFVDWVREGSAAEKIWSAISWVLENSLKFMYETVAIWKTLTAYVNAAGEAFSALTSGDFSAASAALSKAGTDSAAAWAEAEKQFADYKATLDAYSGSGAPGKGDFGLPETKKLAPDFGGGTTKTSGVPKIAAVPKDTIDSIYGTGEAFQTLWDNMESGIPTTNLLAESFQNMADTIADSLSTALVGLITGTQSVSQAFESMLQSISQMLEELAAQIIKSQIFQLLGMLAGGIAGGGGAGLNIGGMVFGGLFANGGHLGSGQWGIAGENGPEIIHGPANITPIDGMGGSAPQMNVTVINNSAAQVATRQGTNGGLDVIIEDKIAAAFARGGNKIDSAIQKGYGLRRAGR